VEDVCFFLIIDVLFLNICFVIEINIKYLGGHKVRRTHSLFVIPFIVTYYILLESEFNFTHFKNRISSG